MTFDRLIEFISILLLRGLSLFHSHSSNWLLKTLVTMVAFHSSDGELKAHLTGGQAL